MTRNYIFLFLFILLISSSLLIGIAGPQGMVVNRSIEKHLETRQHELDVQRIKLENLNHRMDEIWTTGSLLDNARAIGYVQPGQTVYFFFDEDGNPLPDHQEDSFTVELGAVAEKTGQDPTKGLSYFLIFLISIIFSLVLVILMHRFFDGRRETVVLKFNDESFRSQSNPER
jgi:hypothetical protein